MEPDNPGRYVLMGSFISTHRALAEPDPSSSCLV
nr:MAG TPA: hypothetical protein [Caudoviricetes sp.]